MAEEATEKLEGLDVTDELEAAFGVKAGKKKPKKKVLNLEEEEASAPAEGEGEAAGEGEDLDMSEFDLSKTKKKKKSSKKKAEEGEGDEAPKAEGGEGGEAGPDEPWENSDRDYKYDELLDRVYGILREYNPELTGEKKRTILKPPQVAREGTKKTVFTNFPELCKLMSRSQEHVMQYLLAELGASGSLDGQNRLIVKGRFLPKAFENVLRRYMIEYVLCSSCKSPDTALDRDASTRLMYMKCNQCGASRSVSTVKSGFQARVTSRKAERAAQG